MMSGALYFALLPFCPPAEHLDEAREQKEKSPPEPPAAPQTPPSSPVKLEEGELWGGCKRVAALLWEGAWPSVVRRPPREADFVSCPVEGEQLGVSS